MAHHAILFVTMRDHGCLVLVQKATVFTMARGRHVSAETSGYEERTRIRETTLNSSLARLLQ